MKFLAIAALAIMPAASEAATYRLTGAEVTGCTVEDETTPCASYLGATIRGVIRVKRSELGPLGNRHLSWNTDGSGLSLSSLKVRLTLRDTLGQRIALPFHGALAGAFFDLVTRPGGGVKRWSLGIFDGPPDYLFRPGGLQVYAGGSEWTGSSGTLRREWGPVAKAASPAPVPIPAAGLLLAGSLGLLALLRPARARR